MNNSRVLRFQNAKFSGYHFYMNTNICRDFQICISVPLNGVIYILKPKSIKSANVFKERKWIIFFFTVVFCLMIHNIYLKRYCLVFLDIFIMYRFTVESFFRYYRWRFPKLHYIFLIVKPLLSQKHIFSFIKLSSICTKFWKQHT